ncbi:MAG: hypothetical protein AAF206_18260 [Bacteroidota bacterium]
MRQLFIIICLFLPLEFFGQETLTFQYPDGIGTEDFDWNTISPIHHIELQPNGSFSMLDMSSGSCYLWRQYDGQWRQNGDSVFLTHQYEVKGPEMLFTHSSQPDKQYFEFDFSANPSHLLREREVELRFHYAFDRIDENGESVRLDGQVQDFSYRAILNQNNQIFLPFDSVPQVHQLFAISFSFRISTDQTREAEFNHGNSFLTISTDLPNQIQILLVEQPERETIYRKLTAIIKENQLHLVTNTHTETHLEDPARRWRFFPTYEMKQK